MQKLFITIAGISGALAVMLGAMGAHALKDRISPELLQAFETGVRYQVYHWDSDIHAIQFVQIFEILWILIHVWHFVIFGFPLLFVNPLYIRN
jgi:uncharacterized membrane protein YgdD (TMEM256/DUF423 family)